jgi:starvation-inducible DNA-binding protein
MIDHEMTRSRSRWGEADELQEEMRDLLSLAVFGDHVRWVLVDDAELAAWLAEAVPKWRAWAGEAARRLAALGIPPDGRLRSLAQDIPSNWVPDGWLEPTEARRLVDHRVHVAAGRAHYRQSQAKDPALVELLDRLCTGLEEQARSRDAVAVA